MAAHLLSFVADSTGMAVTIHADLSGVELLINQLQLLRTRLLENDCPHIHLFSPVSGGNELSVAMLKDQPNEVHQVCHVKMYGWNEEWAKRHGLIT